MYKFLKWSATALFVVHLSAWSVTAVQPTHDGEVVELLPAITHSRRAGLATPREMTNPAASAQAARQDIALARQTGDTRYWGRAQAALAPWWNHADAPIELAVLQATVQQGRHEFDASRKLLLAALARTPGHAQGWLNLAALERLLARYPAALVACDAVQRAGQGLYASACRLEAQSLQGQHAVAEHGLQALLATPGLTADQQSWLHSLLAESQERSGRDSLAAAAYQRSLALQPDLYTSIAFSDLLLRTGKIAAALQALAPLPQTDAVLLRRASAWRRLGNSQWQGARALLQARAAELIRRGDDPTLHGREAALVALWLDDDPTRALALARSNLSLQREPVDWWVALQSARQAKDAAAQADIEAAIAAVGLKDARLRLSHAAVASTHGGVK